MASLFYTPTHGQTWGEYLIRESVDDLQRTVASASTELVRVQHEQTRALITAEENSARTIAEHTLSTQNALRTGFDELSGMLAGVRDVLDYRLDAIEGGLKKMHVQLQQTVDQLDSINKTLKRPEKTAMREQYRNGCDRLRRGLIGEALKSFQLAALKDETDALTQFNIGRIYLYGKNADYNVLDVPRAVEHLSLAEKYAKADMPFAEKMRHITAEILYHASVAYMVTAKETVNKGAALSTAAKKASEASQLQPSSAVYAYQTARCYALCGDAVNSSLALTHALRQQPRISLQAVDDPAFDRVPGCVHSAVEQVRGEMLESAKNKLAIVQKEIDEIAAIGGTFGSIRNVVLNKLQFVEVVAAQGTLIDLSELQSRFRIIESDVSKWGCQEILKLFPKLSFYDPERSGSYPRAFAEQAAKLHECVDSSGGTCLNVVNEHRTFRQTLAFLDWQQQSQAKAAAEAAAKEHNIKRREAWLRFGHFLVEMGFAFGLKVGLFVGPIVYLLLCFNDITQNVTSGGCGVSILSAMFICGIVPMLIGWIFIARNR